MKIHSMKTATYTFSLMLGALAAIIPQPSLHAQAPDQSTSPTVVAVNATDDQGLRFNFRGVPLDTVLDYLAQAAGFIIIREATVEGRVDVVSHQPLSREEAVALLNTVLNKKGYAAIRNERTLTIVTLEEARKRDIPVQMGRNPEQVAKGDEMITQIIPVGHANATQLIKNIEMLLPTYAVVTANESSNAVVLTATKTDARRIMEIIQALDTTMSEVSTIRVFKLLNADATEAAKVINDLFKTQNSGGNANSNNNRRSGLPFMMFGRGGPGGGPEGEGASTSGSGGASPAVQVVAVADAHTNSVVVSAPAEVISTLETLFTQLDTTSVAITEIRVFPLRYSDAQTMAQNINSVFNPSQSTAQTSSTNNRDQGRSTFFRRMLEGGPPGMGDSAMQAGGQSGNGQTKDDVEVSAVADVRTNSVVVNSSKNLMDQVAQMIEQLDSNPAKERKVHVYTLKYADPAQTAVILDEMFGDRQNNSSRLSTASTQRAGTTSRSTNSSSNTRSNNSSGGSVPGGLGSSMGGGF